MPLSAFINWMRLLTEREVIYIFFRILSFFPLDWKFSIQLINIVFAWNQFFRLSLIEISVGKIPNGLETVTAIKFTTMIFCAVKKHTFARREQECCDIIARNRLHSYNFRVNVSNVLNNNKISLDIDYGRNRCKFQLEREKTTTNVNAPSPL